MKTVGMLGGMSWESTLTYYQAINRGVQEALGALHSAKIILVSVDFEEIEKCQRKGDWEKTATVLSRSAQQAEAGGADFLVLCTNTMHKVVPEIEASISIPVLHIVDATAEQLKQDGIKQVGLLGTRFTMEQAFYKERLKKFFDVEVMLPLQDQRELVHRVIYEELCLGELKECSRKHYLEIIETLYTRGAEAVILGCTEIALLVKQSQTSVPLYDTTTIHAASAVEWALKGINRTSGPA